MSYSNKHMVYFSTEMTCQWSIPSPCKLHLIPVSLPLLLSPWFVSLNISFLSPHLQPPMSGDWIFLLSVNMIKGSSIVKNKNPAVDWTTLLWFHNLLKPLSLPLLLFTVLETSRRRIQNPLPLMPHCVLHLLWLRSAADPPHSLKPRGDRTQFPAPQLLAKVQVWLGRKIQDREADAYLTFRITGPAAAKVPVPSAPLNMAASGAGPRLFFPFGYCTLLCRLRPPWGFLVTARPHVPSHIPPLFSPTYYLTAESLGIMRGCSSSVLSPQISLSTFPPFGHLPHSQQPLEGSPIRM